MNEPIPVMDGEPLSAEDERLLALFDKLEADQLGFLDEAGKRIVEVASVMLGILFGVTAFGDSFPPAYLTGAATTKWLVLAALLLYLAAIGAGLYAAQPRTYRRYTGNLTLLRDELARILAHKRRWVRIGAICFGLASLALAWLVAALVWNA